MTDDRNDDLLRIWEKTVDVQMHFNDLSMRIRNLFVSLVSALVAASGAAYAYLQNGSLKFGVFGFEIHLIIFVLLALLTATSLFYFMDRHWYHRYLKAAGKCAGSIESNLNLPKGLALSTEIAAASKLAIQKFSIYFLLSFLLASHPKIEVDGKKISPGARVRKELTLDSDNRLEMFYKVIVWPSLLALALAILFGGVRTKSDLTIAECIYFFIC